MNFEFLGTLTVTADWLWLAVPTSRETFKIVHNCPISQYGYALIAQGFSQNFLIATSKRVYPRGSPDLVILPIPSELKLAGETTQHIGVKLGRGYLHPDQAWSIDIYQLIIPGLL